MFYFQVSQYLHDHGYQIPNKITRKLAKLDDLYIEDDDVQARVYGVVRKPLFTVTEEHCYTFFRDAPPDIRIHPVKPETTRCVFCETEAAYGIYRGKGICLTCLNHLKQDIL